MKYSYWGESIAAVVSLAGYTENYEEKNNVKRPSIADDGNMG